MPICFLLTADSLVQESWAGRADLREKAWHVAMIAK